MWVYAGLLLRILRLNIKTCHGRNTFSINFLNLPDISKILHFATSSCILSDTKGYITSEKKLIFISNKKFYAALLESIKKSETFVQFFFKVWRWVYINF